MWRVLIHYINNRKIMKGYWSSVRSRWLDINRPHPIYQYSNMAPGLSGQTSIFGVVFVIFIAKSFLGVERQKKLKKFTILTRKPRSHVRILIYRERGLLPKFFFFLRVHKLAKKERGQYPAILTEQAWSIKDLFIVFEEISLARLVR